MNCDEAFDAMTSAAGGNSPELHWHLEMCPRCREMREVLAPALQVLGTDACSSDQPGQPSVLCEDFTLPRVSLEAPPQPLLSPEALLLAENTARSLTPGYRRRGKWLVLTAAICLFACISWFGLRAAQSSSPSSSGRNARLVPTTEAGPCVWLAARNTPTEATGDSNEMQSVVLSCVACHLNLSPQ